MKIEIIGFENCSRCKKIKESLNYIKIEYEVSDCNRNPGKCDALEDIAGTNQYPMVLISGLERDISEIVFISDSASVLQGGVKMKDTIRLVPNHSTDGLIRYVINRLNLKL